MQTVKKIAAYVRPWSVKYFEYFLPLAFDKAEAVYLSDFRGLGSYDWCGRFYFHLNYPSGDYKVPYWLDARNISEIITRNYLLRALSYTEARKMVQAMSCAIEDTLNAVSPDAFVSPSADSYVMDLLIRHCRYREIPFCGLVPCPFPGYTRASAIGEYFSFRKPTKKDCAKALKTIKNPSFQPIDLVEWLKMYGNSFIYLKRCVREIPKKIYFYLLGKIKNDPKNYHYLGNSLSKVSFFTQGLFLKNFFCQQWLKKMKNWKGIRVYLPLQVYPESTTDYHVQNLDLINFPELIIRLIKKLATNKEFLICIKEHPGMMGARPPGFYTEILKQKNILLISGEVMSSAVIPQADVTLLWTGTGGLESAIRGKPVITIGRPYYYYGKNFSSLENLKDLEKIPEKINRILRKPIRKNETKKIVKNVLAGAFPGNFLFINFNKKNTKMVKEAQYLAKNIKKLWPQWQQASQKKLNSFSIYF